MNNKKVALMVCLLIAGKVHGTINPLPELQKVSTYQGAAHDMIKNTTQVAAMQWANRGINKVGESINSKHFNLQANDLLSCASSSAIMNSDNAGQALNGVVSLVAGKEARSLVDDQVVKYTAGLSENMQAGATVAAAIGAYMANQAVERQYAAKEQTQEAVINDAINGTAWYVVCVTARALGYPLNGDLFSSIFGK